MDAPYRYIPIHEIGQRHAGLRIIDPGAEAAMERSMRQYGQMTPIVVGRFKKDGYEVVDGFKRLRAGIKLGYEGLDARIFNGGVRAAKAAMIQFNSKARSMSDLEKALVIRSLHKDDGLKQVEIAKLLARHPSWVCRRLALVERLCDEVVENLRLGLINVTSGRELAKLPRGNQIGAMETAIKHRFTSDETARLTAMLINEPRWNHESILAFPAAILHDRQPERPSRPKRLTFLDRIIKMQMWLGDAPRPAQLSDAQRDLLLSAMNRIEEAFGQIRRQLNDG
jgi:ParB/RepB/Spo0J family partition protein